MVCSALFVVTVALTNQGYPFPTWHRFICPSLLRFIREVLQCLNLCPSSSSSLLPFSSSFKVRRFLSFRGSLFTSYPFHSFLRCILRISYIPSMLEAPPLSPSQELDGILSSIDSLSEATAHPSTDVPVVEASEVAGLFHSCFVAPISSHLLSDAGALVEGGAQSN